MPTVTNKDGSQVSKTVALQKLYECLNGPVSANMIRVTYSRDQVEAMLYVIRQLVMLQTDTTHGKVQGELTVGDLIKLLEYLPQNEIAMAYCPNALTYLPVTGVLYGQGEAWFDCEPPDGSDDAQEDSN